MVLIKKKFTMETLQIKKITGLTELEKKVLTALVDGMYAEWGFSDVGATDLSESTGIPKKSIRGVIGSLVKKGLVYVDDRTDMCDYRSNDPAWEPIIYLQNDAEALVPNWQEQIGFKSVIED
jgi:hypothetical protein